MADIGDDLGNSIGNFAQQTFREWFSKCTKKCWDSVCDELKNKQNLAPTAQELGRDPDSVFYAQAFETDQLHLLEIKDVPACNQISDELSRNGIYHEKTVDADIVFLGRDTEAVIESLGEVAKTYGVPDVDIKDRYQFKDDASLDMAYLKYQEEAAKEGLSAQVKGLSKADFKEKFLETLNQGEDVLALSGTQIDLAPFIKGDHVTIDKQTVFTKSSDISLSSSWSIKDAETFNVLHNQFGKELRPQAFAKELSKALDSKKDFGVITKNGPQVNLHKLRADGLVSAKSPSFAEVEKRLTKLHDHLSSKNRLDRDLDKTKEITDKTQDAISQAKALVR